MYLTSPLRDIVVIQFDNNTWKEPNNIDTLNMFDDSKKVFITISEFLKTSNLYNNPGFVNIIQKGAKM